MMKDWADARQKIADMKAVDPKQAKKMESEITNVRVISVEFYLIKGYTYLKNQSNLVSGRVAKKQKKSRFCTCMTFFYKSFQSKDTPRDFSRLNSPNGPNLFF